MQMCSIVHNRTSDWKSLTATMSAHFFYVAGVIRKFYYLVVIKSMQVFVD